MTNPIPHKSDSLAQRNAESVALAELNAKRGSNLCPELVDLPNGTRVQIDGFDRNSKVACEIYAGIGRLKGAQPDKLASDILKLVLVEKHLGGKWTKIICFIDEESVRSLRNKSWLASTCVVYDIEVVVAEIPALTRTAIIEARAHQKMVNVAD